MTDATLYFTQLFTLASKYVKHWREPAIPCYTHPHTMHLTGSSSALTGIQLEFNLKAPFSDEYVIVTFCQ
jgi:hypothetical protein